MGGDRQAPGTPGAEFDPAPQFAVHEVEEVHAAGVVLTGRCYFGPVGLRTEFTRLARLQPAGPSPTTQCHLRVADIGVYGRHVDALDQTWTARLWLTGAADGLHAGTHAMRTLLVADRPPPEEWEWDGRLWLHRSAPDRTQQPPGDETAAGRGTRP